MDARNPGANAVGDGEVEDPLRSAERNRRLGTADGQRAKTLTAAAGENDRRRVGSERSRCREADGRDPDLRQNLAIRGEPSLFGSCLFDAHHQGGFLIAIE
jgi:hypothetical protein